MCHRHWHRFYLADLLPSLTLIDKVLGQVGQGRHLDLLILRAASERSGGCQCAVATASCLEFLLGLSSASISGCGRNERKNYRKIREKQTKGKLTSRACGATLTTIIRIDSQLKLINSTPLAIAYQLAFASTAAESPTSTGRGGRSQRLQGSALGRTHRQLPPIPAPLSATLSFPFLPTFRICLRVEYRFNNFFPSDKH